MLDREITGEQAEGLSAIVSKVISWSKDGEEVEAYASKSEETEIRVHNGEIESYTVATDAGVGIRVVKGHRQGFAYAGSLEEKAIASALAEARDNADFASEDPAVGLADPDGVLPVELNLWDSALESYPRNEKISMALSTEERLRNGDKRIREVPSVDYADLSTSSAIASTRGITASTSRTRCYLSAVALAGEESDTQTGFGISTASSPVGLDQDKVIEDALSRAIRMLGAKKPRSARTTVVFDPRVTQAFLSVLSSALSGDSVAKGRSFLAHRVGEQVGSNLLTLVEDPTDERAYGSSPYDAEGLASRRHVLIMEGVLLGFLHDSTSARRMGTTSTASAVRGGFATPPGVGCRALRLEPGGGASAERALDPTELLIKVGDGIYVQSVTGMHSGVNPISGDFSVGIEGLSIRGGELGDPVREATVASTMQRMLGSVVAIGSDIEWLPGIAAGQSLALADMSLSGL
ncbi:MAG: TldD/PmbA family protein [Actinobacteria bacterium]|nr:TldD/PmbA family protein [Actinomycetota bacterium]